jgi:hypothetical protein
MPGFSDYAENQVLDDIYNSGTGFAVTGDPFISLHTADPGDTGANEVTGGAGPYARQQAAFSVSASGTTDNDANIDFAGMPAVTVVAWGVWDAVSAGNCIQTGWLSTVSGLAVVRTADVAGNDIQTADASGLVTDDRVIFETIEGLTAPAGLTLGQVYFVLVSGVDTFTVSDSSGGAEEDITAEGSAIWRKVTPKVVNAGDTFRIAAGDLDIFATE